MYARRENCIYMYVYVHTYVYAYYVYCLIARYRFLLFEDRYNTVFIWISLFSLLLECFIYKRYESPSRGLWFCFNKIIFGQKYFVLSFWEYDDDLNYSLGSFTFYNTENFPILFDIFFLFSELCFKRYL